MFSKTFSVYIYFLIRSIESYIFIDLFIFAKYLKLKFIGQIWLSNKIFRYFHRFIDLCSMRQSQTICVRVIYRVTYSIHQIYIHTRQSLSLHNSVESNRTVTLFFKASSDDLVLKRCCKQWKYTKAKSEEYIEYQSPLFCKPIDKCSVRCHSCFCVIDNFDFNILLCKTKYSISQMFICNMLRQCHVYLDICDLLGNLKIS